MSAAGNFPMNDASRMSWFQVLERLEAQGCTDDEIVVSVELMKGWFDTVIDDIIRAVEDTLARVSDTGNTVDYMLVVGGFGGSPYLIASLREAFSNQVKEVVCPGVPSQAVLKGKTPPPQPLSLLPHRSITSCPEKWNRSGTEWVVCGVLYVHVPF